MNADLQAETRLQAARYGSRFCKCRRSATSRAGAFWYEQGNGSLTAMLEDPVGARREGRKRVKPLSDASSTANHNSSQHRCALHRRAGYLESTVTRCGRYQMRRSLLVVHWSTAPRNPEQLAERSRPILRPHESFPAQSHPDLLRAKRAARHRIPVDLATSEALHNRD